MLLHAVLTAQLPDFSLSSSDARCFFVKLWGMHDAVSLDCAGFVSDRFDARSRYARALAPALRRASSGAGRLVGRAACLLVSRFQSVAARVGRARSAAVRRRAQAADAWRAFLLGWITGTLFFYGSCYWLTYAMIRYGGIPASLAYLLLVPGALVVGLFPLRSALALARVVARWGARALFFAPFLWAALGMGAARRDGPAVERHRLLAGLSAVADPGGALGRRLRGRISHRHW